VLSGLLGQAGIAEEPGDASVGWAPTPSQCLIRSSFKVIRSAWPRSSIGL